ncbi:DUF6692 family protein [Sphingosinicella rhizophila]|uniref:DUF6692 domain-containing protein n=1 Tax=Sphingosinicella rhizophila TaxID=3050082 RepID=A0ABU3QA02_9SPHN|nr:DUF6692 family protein [Sphingosinicella sp. GR2756]MDT9600236.1 hypothetical protein [Sphingosinicella sp. GR2756]
MRRLQVLCLLSILVALSGCNRNASSGNDREARLDAVPTASPRMGAAAALQNVAPEAIKPETMSQADIASLGGLAGKCALRLTEVAHPTFIYQEGRSGAIKLNGKLIMLPSTRDDRFAEDGLSVTLSPKGERGDAGLRGIDMIIVLPGAKDELGYSGFVDCREGDAK